jgi:hypothetical protein
LPCSSNIPEFTPFISRVFCSSFYALVVLLLFLFFHAFPFFRFFPRRLILISHCDLIK